MGGRLYSPWNLNENNLLLSSWALYKQKEKIVPKGDIGGGGGAKTPTQPGGAGRGGEHARLVEACSGGVPA